MDQIITDNYLFKSGQPWTDIKAWGADTSISTNETPIQNAIDYMYATYGGGIVFMPPGVFGISNGVTVKGAVRLVGAGRQTSYLNGFGSNVNALTFGSLCSRGCSAEHLTVQGYYNSNVSLVGSNAITIAQNVPANIIDVNAWYGSAGLYTQGIDGAYFNSWFIGCRDGVVSNGANWYNRCILNGNGSFSSYRYGLWQGTGFSGAISQENHFEQCDFSGPFTNSILIDNAFTGTYPVTVFNGCVTSSPISIQHGYWTSFIGHEFGSSSFSLGGGGGTVSVVGSAGFGVSLILSGSQFQKAANFNIS